MITKNIGCVSSECLSSHQGEGLKVSVIEPSGRLYGSEYCLLDIIDGLPRKKYFWTVFLPKSEGFDQLLLDRGINCEFMVPGNLGKMAIWWKSLVYAKILWRLKAIKPDLLYVNQTGSLRSAAVYARWLKLPVVCQVQTLEDARWLSSNPDLQEVVQAFICNSQFIADETVCDPLKKCVLYQGLPAERLERAKSNLSDSDNFSLEERKETFIVGILGRIAVSKGHYLLVSAAKSLEEKLPECKFVVIGEGLTDEETEKFKQAVTESGMESRFEFRGYRQDIETELSRLDLLVIPSLAEPLGRVVFDAAEFGVPVVLSDAGGLGEISKLFNVGERFRSGYAESLSQEILHVANNYVDSRKKFLASSITMLERLSMKSYISNIENILLNSVKRIPSCEVWLGDNR